MTRDELIPLVSRETGEALGIVEQIVDTTFATIRAALDAGDRVDIDNFGRFTVRRYAETLPDRVIEHPAHQQIVFKGAQAWRKAVNGGERQAAPVTAEAAE